MARSYGQVHAAIWRDNDFRSLSGFAQRVYLMLITQPDISSAGTLPLTIRRWSRYASDTPADALSDALSELVRTAFIVIDEDAEELLVRKFVKWDGGYNNEKRRPAIQAAANGVVSGRIRAALAIELDALGVSHDLADALPEGLPDSQPDSPRVVVTEVSTLHNPQPLNLNPETTCADEVAAKRRPREDDPIWDALMAACNVDTAQISKSARGAYNGAVKQLKEIEATPAQVALRARKFTQQWPDVTLTPTALARRWSELNGHSAPARRWEQ